MNPVFIDAITFFMFSPSYVCWGLTSLLNIWGHIATVSTRSSGTLTNGLPHRNAMPQTRDMTSNPFTVFRHGANLSLCYLLMWDVTLEYTTTHFNVLDQTWSGNPSLTFHTHQLGCSLGTIFLQPGFCLYFQWTDGQFCGIWSILIRSLSRNYWPDSTHKS